MILKCPKCERQDLIDATHGTSRCPACNGIFVPVSRVHELLAAGDSTDAAAASSSQDAQSGRCPVDRGIMSRAAVVTSGETPIHLERCGNCRGVWFDVGEWNALSAAHLLDHLDEFWSAEWRAGQRRSVQRAEYEKRLEEAFGADLFAQIRVLAAALRNHPRRSQALAVLREESGDGEPG
jgi:Zn-finger nucleic acid-binding protein